MQKRAGFTLLEMMVVLAIMGILLAIAIPIHVSTLEREQIKESLDLVERLKASVVVAQQINGEMPQTNADAGIPAADKLLGNYVKSIELNNGAFHIAFGNKAVAGLKDKFLTVRAIDVPGSPMSPISWLCGYSQVPTGMAARGEDKTNISQDFLPLKCRLITAAKLH